MKHEPTARMGIELASAALTASVDSATVAALAGSLAQHLDSEHSDQAARALVYATRSTMLADATQCVSVCMAHGSQGTATLLAALVSKSKEAQQMLLQHLPGMYAKAWYAYMVTEVRRIFTNRRAQGQGRAVAVASIRDPSTRLARSTCSVAANLCRRGS